MTFMLASVTSVEEAEIAVRHGADIIDVKDVGSAFGTAAPALVRATVDAVAQRRPISAVVGEPEMLQPTALAHAAAAIADAGASYVKLNLYPHAAQEACVRALTALARRVNRRHVCRSSVERSADCAHGTERLCRRDDRYRPQGWQPPARSYGYQRNRKFYRSSAHPG
jgi:uncharacterized protein (UPF0264 family)